MIKFLTVELKLILSLFLDLKQTILKDDFLQSYIFIEVK